MSAVMSTVRKPMPAELEAETAVQRASRGEILTVAIAGLLLRDSIEPHSSVPVLSANQ